MRCFLCLIGFSAILAFYLKIQQPALQSSLEKGFKKNSFEYPSNYPLSAIENTVSGIFYLNGNQKNYQHKRLNPVKIKMIHSIIHLSEISGAIPFIF